MLTLQWSCFLRKMLIKAMEKKMAVAPKSPGRQRVPLPMSVNTVMRGFPPFFS